MARRDDNVIPFRKKPRKWTRPEDFIGTTRPPPRPPKKPRGPGRSKLIVWALIGAVVALTVAYTLWTLT